MPTGVVYTELEAPADDENPDPVRATKVPTVGATRICPRCGIGELINGMCPEEGCTYPAEQPWPTDNLSPKEFTEHFATQSLEWQATALDLIDCIDAKEVEGDGVNPAVSDTYCDYCEKHVDSQSFVSEMCEPCRVAKERNIEDNVTAAQKGDMEARGELIRCVDELQQALGSSAERGRLRWDDMIDGVRALKERSETRTPTYHQELGKALGVEDPHPALWINMLAEVASNREEVKRWRRDSVVDNTPRGTGAWEGPGHNDGSGYEERTPGSTEDLYAGEEANRKRFGPNSDRSAVHRLADALGVSLDMTLYTMLLIVARQVQQLDQCKRNHHQSRTSPSPTSKASTRKAIKQLEKAKRHLEAVLASHPTATET